VSTPEKPPEPVELSIGSLSSATGVPVDTLRTWERRYGFPVPTARTGGSHRRYAAETIGQVQLIVRALELGHRPSAVVGRDLSELRRLVGSAMSGPSPVASDAESDRVALARWLELSRQMEGEALSGEFHRSLAEMPALSFLERRMGPYLQALGEQWARGLLRVSHEHFASERAREFLTTQWRGASDGQRSRSATAVLATPPGERHALGLHMAAWVIALAGLHVVFIGADTPIAEVAFTAERYSARGVALSVAAGFTGDLEAMLKELAGLLPTHVSIAVGGAGSWAAGSMNLKMNGFRELFDWATGLAREPPAAPRAEPPGH
jgi:DNA-binding transcriptional MerR regulator/methylmalonyl-CoA mutase cobalamin-binding subunit